MKYLVWSVITLCCVGVNVYFAIHNFGEGKIILVVFSILFSLFCLFSSILNVKDFVEYLAEKRSKKVVGNG